METNLIGVIDDQRRKAMQQRVAEWRATASHYESDPATKEGRNELTRMQKKRSAVGTRPNNNTIAMSWQRVLSRSESSSHRRRSSPRFGFSFGPPGVSVDWV
jgi:hypothetical protein